MEVSSPRQALVLISELFSKSHAPNLIDINALVDAGLVAPQSCPTDLLTEAAEALTALLKSDRNHTVTHTLAVESKARTALARICSSPVPAVPTVGSAPMMPFAAPENAAERWNLVRNISFGNFGGTESQRLKTIHALAVGRDSDTPAPAVVPTVILVAARWARNAWDARVQVAERSVGGVSPADKLEIAQLTEALAAYAPPKPPTTEELATALRHLASPGGVSPESVAAARTLLDRMPK